MSNRFVSTRTAFVLVAMVTLVLIIGSVVLNRIVFKAASSSATLYFSQSTIQAKPDTVFSVDVLADLSSAANINGVQLELNFDPQLLRPTNTQPAALWKQVFSRIDEGKLLLVMVPLESGAQTDKAEVGLRLSRVTFVTLAEGATNLTLTPANTLLAVSNSPEAKGVENTVESVIDAQVFVTNTAVATPTDSSLKVDGVTTQSQLVFSSQRIISTSQILASNSAIILVRLEHPGRVSVAFGQTSALGNRADFSALTDQAAVRLAGLEAGQRYYFQVVAEDNDASNRVLGQVKSFELPALSSTNVVDRAELTVFPTRAATSATAYATFFDQENKIISGLAPQLQVDEGGVTATQFSEAAGLYQAALTSRDAGRRTVGYNLLLDSQRYATTTAMFDANLANTSIDSSQLLLGLKFDQKTINLILALVAGLILLGLGFYKLARAR